jgi:hypothetical protein
MPKPSAEAAKGGECPLCTYRLTTLIRRRHTCPHGSIHKFARLLTVLHIAFSLNIRLSSSRNLFSRAATSRALTLNLTFDQLCIRARRHVCPLPLLPTAKAKAQKDAAAAEKSAGAARKKEADEAKDWEDGANLRAAKKRDLEAAAAAERAARKAAVEAQLAAEAEEAGKAKKLCVSGWETGLPTEPWDRGG